jgi:hypothetical protein
MKMKKSFIAILLAVALVCFSSPAMADNADGNGNFEIGTFAIGGGLDADGALIPNGAAGGISGAGGVSVGSAQGSVETIESPIYETTYMGNIYGWGRWNPNNYSSELIGYETVFFGGTEADLYSEAGGFTSTDDYTFDPSRGTGAGVGSGSGNYATTAGDLTVSAFGIADASGYIAGAAGQGSLNGSIIGGSPLVNSDGVSLGVAGQGSLGGFVGAAGAAGLGSADISADIDMWGNSYSESYRFTDGNTEGMGTFVGVGTTVQSYGNVNRSLIGTGFVAGGYVAKGVVGTVTVQVSGNGLAKAKAFGVYSGAGELGCDFKGSANGYTQTTATQVGGMNGSVMSSSAGMNVTINKPEID